MSDESAKNPHEANRSKSDRCVRTAQRMWVVAMAVCVGACRSESPDEEEQDGKRLSVEELQNPETCKSCHPKHFEEWQGSMHAYAAEDPVFLAMNAKGQKETNGELGDFCIKCHAPLAVELGLTTDGLNLDEVPQWAHGVGCYSCHNVQSVEGLHNNQLVLAMDQTMRGNIRDAMPSSAHETAYDPHLDGLGSLKSADLCGSCHDVQTPAGVHLERTYLEWHESLYSKPSDDDPDKPDFPIALTCNNCHLPGKSEAITNVPDAPSLRLRHDHRMAAVDQALTPFPDAASAPDYQKAQQEAIDELRIGTLCSALCVREAGDDPNELEIQVWLHNESAGHSWPSGAGQDRRAWVDLRVFADQEDEQPLFSSGVVAEGEAIAELDDSNLWLIRDRMFDEQDNEVHMFWEARRVESNLLPVAEELEVIESTWFSKVYRVPSDAAEELFEANELHGKSQVEMRVRLRPMGMEIIDNLIAEGYLDAAIKSSFSTAVVDELRWTVEGAEEIKDFGLCVHSTGNCRPPAHGSE